ncbi:O-antigen ligase family protein [Patulibacter minatonensis]|uniref:O-antigen ligase family protein n=1 Tax=Patulibacter minatonensis TaxID=298163 RepID=UPI00047C7724|nr:O-antigen ligase family protein [Patulibacter minatonensis]
MATTLALSTVAVAAFLALWLRSPNARAGTMAIALVGAPIILAAQVWDAGPVERLRDHPPVLGALIVAGALVVVAAAWAFRRWPVAVPFAAAVALPFRVPLDLGDGQPVNLLLPLYLVTGAAALAWLWDRAQADPDEPGGDRRPGAADLALLLFVVLYAVESLWSDDQSKAVEQVAFFYVPFALLYVVLRTVPWTMELAAKCFAVVVGVALVLAGVGFYEAATHHVLLNPRVIASNQIDDVFRVNSLFFDPNIYGRFLALTMLGIATWMLWTRSSRTVAISGVLLAILLGALITTYSQTSFLAMLAGLTVLGGLRFGPWKAFGSLVAVVLVGVVFVVAAPGALNIKGLDEGGADDATSGRVTLTGGGIGLWADHPIEGVGSGGFAVAYRRAERSGERKAVDASHTIPITIAAEQGLIGFGAYLVLIVLLLRRLVRDAEDSAARAAIAAMTIALIVHTMGYAAFLEDPVLWVLLAVGSALAPVRVRGEARRARLRLRKAPPRERRRPATDPAAP